MSDQIKNDPQNYIKRADLGAKRQDRNRLTPENAQREKDYLTAPIDDAGYIDFQPSSAQSDDALPPIDLARPGRMISASRSGYIQRYPNHVVAFNAGLYLKSKGHIWSGDLDVNRDTSRLRVIATQLGEDLFILREADFRPARKVSEVPWEKAVVIIPHGQHGA
jgi:hypothetical protein